MDVIVRFKEILSATSTATTDETFFFFFFLFETTLNNYVWD